MFETKRLIKNSLKLPIIMKNFLVFVAFSSIILFMSCTNSREKKVVNDTSSFIAFDSCLLPIESKDIVRSDTVNVRTIHEIPVKLIDDDSIVLALRYAEDGVYTLDVFRYMYCQPSKPRPILRDYEIKITNLRAGVAFAGSNSTHFNLIDEDKYGLPGFISGIYFQPIESGYTGLVEISYKNKVLVRFKLIPDNIKNSKRYTKLIAWKRV